MNPTISILLAPVLGRKRTYTRLLAHLSSIRADPEVHRRDCLILLRKWNLNWEIGSRHSCVLDYTYLDSILKEWLSVHDRDGRNALITQARHLCEKLVAITEDDKNYRADGRMMKGDAASRAATMLEQLLSSLRTL